MASSSEFDFRGLQALIRDRLRPVFRSAVDASTGSDLYTFGLRTDDDGTIITPLCNSQQNVREQMNFGEDEEFPPPEDDEMEFGSYCDARWRDEEWSPEIISYDDGTFRIDEADEAFQQTAAAAKDHFGGVAYAAMILALRDLDREGVFGERGDSTFLFCVNSDGCGWLPYESGEQLNNSKAARRFSKEYALAHGRRPKPKGSQYESYRKWFPKFAD